MPETSKTLRQLLLGKIHRATVTRADLHYVGSISLDATLIEAAGFLPNEKVDIYNVTNGARLATYVIPVAAGSGEIGINGAAAHLVSEGDMVIIASYGWMKEKQAHKHVPRVVFVDSHNAITSTTGVEENPAQHPLAQVTVEALPESKVRLLKVPKALKSPKKQG
jgi:aspartate 1-decarboxylase